MQKNSNNASVSLLQLFAAGVISLLISACSDGGISGTGDGGPTIPTVDNITDASVSTDTDDSSADSPADSSDEAPADEDTIPQTPDTTLLLPAALQQLLIRDENTSAAQPMATQLTALQQQAVAALEVTNTTTGTLTPNVNDAFDATFRYSFENTEILLARSSLRTVSYLFSSNDEHTLYVLQENNLLTVRHLDKTLNSLLQARSILLADGSIIIEADLNQNGNQSYLQSYSNSTNTTVFTQHPTDATIARQRELISTTGSVLTIQNCTAVSQDCSLDNSWSNANASDNTNFANAQDAIDLELADSVSTVISLPDASNEAVLSQSTTTTPTEEQIQCGIQRVAALEDNKQDRTFCVLPLPLGATSLFGETLAGGEIFYQLLEQ